MQEINVRVNNEWKDPDKVLPTEGDVCLVTTSGSSLPIYCTYRGGEFYVITTKFGKKDFTLKLDLLTESVKVLSWRSNLGLLLVK